MRDDRVAGVLLIAGAFGLAWAWLNGHLDKLTTRTRAAIRQTTTSTGIVGSRSSGGTAGLR